MRTSIFSYSITRKYKYRWFTPTVIVGGIALLVCFSVVNYASTGYRLAVQQSVDPNITESQQYLPNWTSFLGSRIRPSCQPTDIRVGSTVITTNNALSYVITSIENEGANLPSLIYLNNPLSRCAVSKVNVLLDLMDRSAEQMTVSPWGVEIHGETSCTVHSDIGPITVNMTAVWNPYPSITRQTGNARFIGRNETSRASLFWGESLLSNFQVHLQDQLWHKIPNGNWNKISKLVWGFWWGGSENDITNINFFNSSYRGVAAIPSSWGQYQSWSWPPPAEAFSRNLSDFRSMHLGPLVDTMDGLAKSMNSTILTDLGQNFSYPNILTDPKLLQHFTANFTNMLATNRTYGEAGPAFQSYEELLRDPNHQSGTLHVTPATLASTYVCSIPQRKPWPELVLAILVADLVFMRTSWSMFILCFGLWMAKDNSECNWCEGCLNAAEKGSDSGTPSSERVAPDDHSQSSIPLMLMEPQDVQQQT